MPSLVSKVFAGHFLLALKSKIHQVGHVLANCISTFGDLNESFTYRFLYLRRGRTWLLELNGGNASEGDVHPMHLHFRLW